jgi:predicted lactoylglutathione lyase/uncharacterized RDD family membrane protein YckC
MHEFQTPLAIEGVNDSLYADFWSRLGSLFLDAVFTLPFYCLILYLNSSTTHAIVYTAIPSLLFAIAYHVYLPKKYGGTPGKLVAGISIIRLDGQPIGYKEAFVRQSILLLLTLMKLVIMIIAAPQANDNIYRSLSWIRQPQYLITFEPGAHRLNLWLDNIWVYGELIVLLTNKRKRAIHDYMAGTVIVKTKYIGKIRKYMNADEGLQIRQIWANLPVKDLSRTTAFYMALGFTPNGESEDLTSFTIGKDAFVIHFFLEEKFKADINGEVADPVEASEIVFSLSAESIEKVDEWAVIVKNAGASIYKEPQPVMKGYTFGFSDPDGHKFNVLYWPGM